MWHYQFDVVIRSLKFTEGERKHLKSLITDCNIYGLTEKQSLEYIYIRFGQEISPSYFYFIKKSLQSDTEVQAWLNDFCRVGFVSEHRKRIEELQPAQQILFEMLFKELQKGDNTDQSLILSVMNEMSKIGKHLTNSQYGTPILSQIKAILEQEIYYKNFEP